MRVFISYSSADKEFVGQLAGWLKGFSVEVWYDEWEIKVGDSLVEKIFAGIKEADALVVVLSKASVHSKWVKEELNTAIIRKIEDSDILLLPVLKEDCEIPTPLRQLRYADFRNKTNTGLMHLMDAIEPTRTLWDCLKYLKEHHELVIEQIRSTFPEELIRDKVDKLHELMSSALDVRCQIELRRTGRPAISRDFFQESRDFFQKIDDLAEAGVDVRSLTWNTFVYFRASISHNVDMQYARVMDLAEVFRERYDFSNRGEILDHAFDRLRELMTIICEQQLRLPWQKE